MAIIDFIFGQAKEVLAEKDKSFFANLTELRLGVNRPAIVRTLTGESFLTARGRAVISTKRDIQASVEAVCNYSLFAFGDEIKNGFVTIQNGCRVGLCGRTVTEGGQVKTLKNISSLNFRAAREIKGCADTLFPLCSGKNVLIVSPPGRGKTTLLRDLIRKTSNGGQFVSVVDERSEIAACEQGEPSLDVGTRTDVLDGCPKSAGIKMVLRAMSPDIIAADELSGSDDIAAAFDALNAGVKLFCTAHGADIDELLKRQGIKDMIDAHAFDVYCILGRETGKISKIFDKELKEICLK